MISTTRQRLVADRGRVSASRTRSPWPAAFCSSWALSRVVRRIVFPYRRCWRMSSNWNTTVLSILSETTTPTRTLRLPRWRVVVVALWSAIGYSLSSASSRWRMTVSTRAMSLRTSRSRCGSSSWPVTFWNRRLNSSSLASASLAASSSASRSANSRAFMSSLRVHALHELALHGQLVGGQAHGLLGGGLGDAGQLEHHPARLDPRDPPLRGALARAHPGLGRLLGHRLVRVDVDPDLAAAADVAGHGDTGSLDLAVGHPGWVEGLQAVVAEGHGGAAAGQPAKVAAVLLAVLDALRGQHRTVTPRPSRPWRGPRRRPQPRAPGSPPWPALAPPWPALPPSWGLAPWSPARRGCPRRGCPRRGRRPRGRRRRGRRRGHGRRSDARRGRRRPPAPWRAPGRPPAPRGRAARRRGRSRP